MREDQVVAAAVDVDLLAEILAGSWPSTRYASRAGPLPHGLSQNGSPGLAAFQSAKSSRILLALVDLDPRAGQHIVEVAVRELAVIRVGCDAEVDIAVGRVGVVALDQAGDEADDLGHRLGGARVGVGRQNVERLQLLRRTRRYTLGQLLRVAPKRVGAVDDLVVESVKFTTWRTS